MKLVVLLVLVLTIQETISVNAVLLKAHQSHFSIWVVHLIFLIGTSLDIVIGYVAGSLLRRLLKRAEWGNRLTQWCDQLARGKSVDLAKRPGLLILGFLGQPYLDSFIGSWLVAPFSDVFVMVMIGNSFWYASCWLIVLGVDMVVPGRFALVAVVFVSALVLVVSRWLQRRKRNGH
jgi:hypothetical protein